MTAETTRPDVPGPVPAVRLFVSAVSLAGLIALAWSGVVTMQHPPGAWVFLLAGLTMVSSRFAIAVPGQPASVSVSEVFVFAGILLFGPAPAVLIVAADGLVVSLTHKQRRLYRTLFNVAEPAVSTAIAGLVFFAIVPVAPFAIGGGVDRGLLLPAAAMAGAYFVCNTLLQSAAVAVENELPFWGTWRQHALYVGINYYAASSLATLAVRKGLGVDLEVAGMVGPLLLLSYVAYKAAATRIEDAHNHLWQIERLYRATVETLAIAVDAKDQVTHGHIRRVQRHTVALARALGVTDATELKALEAASLLHDIGKLAVPDYVLNKPGALTAGEFEKIKLHAAMGSTILNTVEFPFPVVPIVRHHHEQWCGQGYPDNLAGEAIPLGARIVSVVDCFDALTSDRPYRRRLSDDAAVRILQERRGTMYEPRIVDAFIAIIPALRREDRAIDGTAPPVPVLTAGVPDKEAAGITAMLDPRQLDQVSRILRDTLPGVAPGAEACFFAQVGDGDVLAASRWTAPLGPIVSGRSIALGEGLVGWVAAHRHTIINSHADLDLGDAAASLALGACTAVPVFAFGTLVGVLTFYLPQPGRFSAAQVPLLGVIAQQIGMALVTPDWSTPEAPRSFAAA